MRLRLELRKLIRIKLNQTGFTLIEIIISTIVISLLTAVLMANYHATNQRSQLNIVRQQIISDIRLAQNNSLGSKTYNGAIPQGGWGLNIVNNTSNYTFFADTSGDHRYQSGEANQAYGGKTVNLPSNFNITLRVTRVGSPSSGVGSLNITYEPPDPTITICRPAACDGLVGYITITDNNTSQTKTIRINQFGLVDSN